MFLGIHLCLVGTFVHLVSRGLLSQWRSPELDICLHQGVLMARFVYSIAQTLQGSALTNLTHSSGAALFTPQGADVEDKLWHQILPRCPATAQPEVHPRSSTSRDGHPPPSAPPSPPTAHRHSGPFSYSRLSVLIIFRKWVESFPVWMSSGHDGSWQTIRISRFTTVSVSFSPQISPTVADTQSTDPHVIELGPAVYNTTVSWRHKKTSHIPDHASCSHGTKIRKKKSLCFWKKDPMINN